MTWFGHYVQIGFEAQSAPWGLGSLLQAVALKMSSRLPPLLPMHKTHSLATGGPCQCKHKYMSVLGNFLTWLMLFLQIGDSNRHQSENQRRFAPKCNFYSTASRSSTGRLMFTQSVRREFSPRFPRSNYPSFCRRLPETAISPGRCQHTTFGNSPCVREM